MPGSAMQKLRSLGAPAASLKGAWTGTLAHAQVPSQMPAPGIESVCTYELSIYKWKSASP